MVVHLGTTSMYMCLLLYQIAIEIINIHVSGNADHESISVVAQELEKLAVVM